jgi:hypothetical protein
MDSFDLFDEEALLKAEDALHAAREHRVVHLHRKGALQTQLPRLLERVLARIRRADASRWRLLAGRTVGVRSAELHIYQPGGGVTDPQHRDAGSLLTLSVLLTPPAEFAGGQLSLTHVGGDATTSAICPSLGCGDGVLFASEKRHNVSTLEQGERRTFIIELWEGPTNEHNRHK